MRRFDAAGRPIGALRTNFRPLRRRVRVGEVVAVLGGAALLAGSWSVVAADERVPDWEARLFETVNDVSDLLWPILWGPMQVGSFVGSLVIVGIAGAITRNLRLGLAALISSQVAFWGAKWVKGMVSRGRPQALLADVHLREDAGGLGYISGHTTVAFALAAVLVPSMPKRWQIASIVAAAVVAFARVYAGVHLPLDTVGGAGVGLLCGVFARWAFGLGGEGLPPRPGVDPA